MAEVTNLGAPRPRGKPPVFTSHTRYVAPSRLVPTVARGAFTEPRINREGTVASLLPSTNPPHFPCFQRDYFLTFSRVHGDSLFCPDASLMAHASLSRVLLHNMTERIYLDESSVRINAPR